MEKILVVDYKKCLACFSCKLACAVAHSKSKNLIEAIYEKNKPIPRISIEQIEDVILPIQCKHCEDAPCIKVCPSKAIDRANENSPVILDNKKCIGCHSCIFVCPYGVIKKGADGKSFIKCDLCIARLNQGENPACVEACPTGAIKYISIKDITAEKNKDIIKKYKILIS